MYECAGDVLCGFSDPNSFSLHPFLSTHCFSFLRLPVQLGKDFLFLLDCARTLEI